MGTWLAILCLRRSRPPLRDASIFADFVPKHQSSSCFAIWTVRVAPLHRAADVSRHDIFCSTVSHVALVRLHQPLQLDEARCRCGKWLDSWGTIGQLARRLAYSRHEALQQKFVQPGFVAKEVHGCGRTSSCAT